MPSVEEQIRQQAAAAGVPPDLAVAVARRESSLSQDARGAAGEVGLFQLMPGTAQELGVNPYDTGQNIAGGVTYLRQQYDRFGDWGLALAAYNAGPSRVARGSIPASTQGYVQDILGQPLTAYAGVPTFTTTVWGEPLDGGFPWWIPAAAILFLLLLKRRD